MSAVRKAQEYVHSFKAIEHKKGSIEHVKQVLK
jgi:hypothetical protein